MSNKTEHGYKPIFSLHDDSTDASREADDLDGVMAMIQWALLVLACFACAGVVAGLLG